MKLLLLLQSCIFSKYDKRFYLPSLGFNFKRKSYNASCKRISEEPEYAKRNGNKVTTQSRQ
jgi:hypothetical protein